MKIIIINGSPRVNGATGQVLTTIKKIISNLQPDIQVEYVNLGDYRIRPCSGCLACYKTGTCYIQDDGIEKLSQRISICDGLILGSPTYASNVSGNLKSLIDRGHFVFEQLLRDKACFSVVTYENFGGYNTEKVIHDLIHFSGGSVSGKYKLKLNHGAEVRKDFAEKSLHRKCKKFIIKTKRDIPLTAVEKIMRFFIFNFGLKQQALRNQSRYQAIITKWADSKLLS